MRVWITRGWRYRLPARFLARRLAGAVAFKEPVSLGVRLTMPSLWTRCVSHLEHELSEQELNTWIRPLHAQEDDGTLRLLAPNRFVMDWVRDRFLPRISKLAQELD